MLFFTLFAFASAAIVHRSPEYHKSYDVQPVTSMEAPVSFTFSVRESNIQQLRDIVVAVSDPASPEYGNYLTGAEIEELTRPAQEDIDAVTSWLTLADVSFTVVNNRDIQVTTTVGQATSLLSTKFVVLNRALVRAGDFSLPESVHAVSAVFGLHGLPIPAHELPPRPREPANVTPAVLAATYEISGVKPTGSEKRLQAVAEFQGQYMNDTDLAEFFKRYVPKADAEDGRVFKFVGSKDRQQAGIEASLDIQYIMGVAPGVKTEFWLFAGMDFCGDLKNWTDQLIEKEDAPLVTSVSYGWQGNLTQIGCKIDNVRVVDANFAKLAAKGISIVFASGDSGSGYSEDAPSRCEKSSYHKGIEFKGEILQKIPSSNGYEECCAIAGQLHAEGYMYQEVHAKPGVTCELGDTGKRNHAYSGKPTRRILLHTDPKTDQGRECCEMARTEGPYFSVTAGDSEPDTEWCNIFATTTEPPTVKSKRSWSGKAGVPEGGICTLFSRITGNVSKTGVTSGKPVKPPTKVVLWPSWPASSPYVTAVGATRFVGQKVGEAEMATDQFGSGGGFSQLFTQEHAQWQVEAVKHYVDNPPDDKHYPPKGSFPVDGRATPDVCALGEGYQVVADGHIESVGGTSASAPAFAGVVALLNEARAQKGMKPMGFLNPFLYANPDAFKDVKLGTNAIGRGNGPIKYGFNATAGWDPATGLGSPIFPKLLEAALKAGN